MKRKIVRIDRNLCDGCGLCVKACAEGAIQLVDGKAALVSDVYCDGLGACLGECPRDAITLEEREAAAFDEQAVAMHLNRLPHSQPPVPSILACGCPGSAMRTLDAKPVIAADRGTPLTSHLGHWPVQLKLVPPQAPFLQGAEIVVCADCVPFAYPDLHRIFLKGRAVLVGCPKLDDLPYYREKLAAIFQEARPRGVTVLKMEVPCCNGLAQAVLQARDAVRPELPVQVQTVAIRGELSDPVDFSGAGRRGMTDHG